jgi:hypothetical protein
MSDAPTPAAPGWPGKLNTVLTAIGAIFATIATIMSTVNKTKIDHINEQVAALDLSEKRQKASSEFADIFLKQVLPDPLLTDAKQKQKHVQALLSVLNIVAQANNGDKGEANVKARGFVPLQLALLLSQPGGLAAMDVDYKYMNDWLAMACADDSDATRVTAIQALGGICQKALLAGRLDVVDNGVKAVDQLFALLAEPKDPKDDLRIPAIAARLQLASFIKREDKLVEDAKLPKDVPGDEKEMRDRIRKAFADSVEKAQDSKAELQKVATGIGPSSAPGSTENAHVDHNLAQLNAALASASEVAHQQAAQASVKFVAERRRLEGILKATTPSGPPLPTGVSPAPEPLVASDQAQEAVDKLIKDLADEDSQKNRQAISQLGLLGQVAVKPLLAEVNKRFGKVELEDKKVRTGVASALKFMRQPINLDPIDIWWAVSLLGAPEQDVRDFSSDFLAGRFPEETIRDIYDQLEATVEPFLYPKSVKPQKSDEYIVSNAAFIVTSWAKLLDNSVQSRERGKPMNAFCLAKATEWRDKLKKSPHRTDWTLTTNLVDRISPPISQRR